MQIAKGMIVKSNSGHDKNRYFLVIDLIGGHAVLADGKRRTLANPKKKNCKHLCATNRIVEPDACLTNKQIRKLLWPFNYQDATQAFE